MNSTPELPRLTKRDGGDPKMIGLWKVGRTIGKGSSGRVRLARHSKTGQYAAVKIVSKTALLNSRMSLHSLSDEADRILHSIEREIVIMKLIDHPHIMRLYDVWETSSELYLILEYVEGGELFDYLCDRGRLPAPEALAYFQQIIAAVHYCHRFNIAHRDLKPENLLIDRDRNIKVADFGMAVWQGADSMLLTACGSPHYAAPEVIRGDAYDGPAADVWSCGVILYALLAGRLPFDDEHLPTLLEKVQIGKFTMPPDIPPAAQDLIRRMLQRDVTKRITIPDILRHPFYTSQKPKQTKCDVPKLDELARPLGSTADIDQDIFANLRTLWPGAEDAAIVARLTEEAPSWEKAVYHLLVKYRTANLESYDEDEERLLAEKQEKRRKAKRAADAQERELALAELPPRAGPPTPSRARTGVSRRSPSPSPASGPGRLQQVSLLGSALSSTPTPALSPVSSTGPSPAVSPLSPRPQQELPSIQVPQVEDERVQQFLHQIAQQLAELKAAGTPVRAQDDFDQLFSPFNTIEPPAPLRTFGNPIQMQAIAANEDEDEDDPFCIVEIPREQTRPLSIRRRADKENATAPSKVGIPHLTVKHTQPDRKSSLGSNTTAASDKRVQLLEPQPPSDRGRLRKRRTPLPSPASPASAFSDGSFVLPSTPRPRWLGALALFQAKPKTYRLLSTQDAARTHATCRRLLAAMGVVVSAGHYVPGGDALVLECTLADSRERDVEGVMTTIRGVRFRVEIGRPSAAHAEAGYVVLLQLVLEKGAAGTLKRIYGRLRMDWDLDSRPVPCELVSTREVEDERFVEVVYEA